MITTATFVGVISDGGFSSAKIDAETLAVGEEVYLGGKSLGVTVGAEGVLIVGKSVVITEEGIREPFAEVELLRGDVLYSVGGVRVLKPSDITRALELSGGEVEVKIKRRESIFSYKVEPALDSLTNEYRLGITVKDDVSGIGTLTYVKQNLRYGALGHHVSDDDAAILTRGLIYESTISGVTRGEKGKAGGLLGSFNKSKPIGTVDANNRFGIFGNIDRIDADAVKIRTASAEEVVIGKAQIVATVTGGKPEYYDIDIVKKINQNEPEVKSMVISVTDKRLLELTGGIVQGMSGSPIIQNGRLIGAVTHVFINDPTRGYGVYIDWMLANL
jgi:stage IV sporulation protein B